MKIGIVSDSHGKTDRLSLALQDLVDRGADHIVHCGDIGDVDAIDALGRTGLPTTVVSGNMDRHAQRLAARAREQGLNFAYEVATIPLDDGRRAVATHGHDRGILRELVSEGQVAYIFHGHTHQVRDERSGQSRVINPGALHRARTHTVALLDTDADQLDLIEVQ